MRGEYLEDNVQEVPIEIMPNIKGLERGKILWMIANDETKFPVAIRDITKDAVTTDYNHPMEGKDLTFDVDLIAMGSRGLNALNEFALGSVSHKVITHATCPALVVK